MRKTVLIVQKMRNYVEIWEISKATVDPLGFYDVQDIL